MFQPTSVFVFLLSFFLTHLSFLDLWPFWVIFVYWGCPYLLNWLFSSALLWIFHPFLWFVPNMGLPYIHWHVCSWRRKSLDACMHCQTTKFSTSQQNVVDRSTQLICFSDIYLFVLCQQTNTKDIAGQSANKMMSFCWYWILPSSPDVEDDDCDGCKCSVGRQWGGGGQRERERLGPVWVCDGILMLLLSPLFLLSFSSAAHILISQIIFRGLALSLGWNLLLPPSFFSSNSFISSSIISILSW